MYKIYCSNKNKFEMISDLLRHSKNDFVFRNFYFFESLGSTQDFAIDLISKSNILEPSVIICDIQSGGRGRKGSAWASPKGGIWMSIIFEPNLKINQLFFNVIITSLLLCSIIKSYINKSVQIKWPNDILVNKKKIAGILMDAQIQNENVKKIILGVGVNANNDIEETTYQIRLSNSTNYEITTIKHERLGISINETELVAKFLYGLSDYYLKLKEVSFRNEILSKYKRMIEESSKNQQYTFTSGGKTFKGEIIRVNDDGSILVRNLLDAGMDSIIRVESAFNIH